jgi:hypothetical protein
LRKRAPNLAERGDDGSALTFLVKLPDVELPDPSQRDRQSGSKMAGPDAPAIPKIMKALASGGPGLYSRPATSNTSKTTTTKPSPPLG